MVLTKPGPLTEEEWEMMRRHPDAGRAILDGIPFLAGAREIVYAHHERWDGKGYPMGLAGDEIPLGAQIFPLCDAFDAMTSDRPYRKALSIEVARKELVEGRGTQFRPDVVDAFLSLDADELDHVRGTSSNESRVVRRRSRSDPIGLRRPGPVGGAGGRARSLAGVVGQ